LKTSDYGLRLTAGRRGGAPFVNSPDTGVDRRAAILDAAVWIRHNAAHAQSNTSRGRQSGATTSGCLLGLALAAGLVMPPPSSSASLERIKLAGDKITVKGLTRKRKWSRCRHLGVRRDGAGRGPAVGIIGNSRRTTASVLKMLATVAGESATVTTTAVNARPQYEVGPGGVQIGPAHRLRAGPQFELSSAERRADRQGRTQASSLISEGVNINSWPPQYFYNDLNAVKVGYRRRDRDAQQRASSSRRAAA